MRLLRKVKPAGLDVDAVFDGESGVEHVYLHGSIAEYTPFHGESLEFAIEMYMAGGTSVEFGRDAAHIMMYKLQVGTAASIWRSNELVGFKG